MSVCNRKGWRFCFLGVVLGFAPGLLWADGWQGAVSRYSGRLQPFLPDAAYVAGTAMAGKLTYGGGVDWGLGDWWGVGLAYRQAQMRYAKGRDRGTAHGAGVRAYAVSPELGRVRLRGDAGSAVIFGQAGDVRVDLSWAVSARGGMVWRLTDRLGVLGWAGLVGTGRVDTDIGYYPSRVMPDYGLGLRVGLWK